MSLPITDKTALLVLAGVFGFVFGILLHRGRVTSYNVIVNQFRLKDWTVFRIMFTAIIVGGIGVLALSSAGLAEYQVKGATMLGIVVGAALFGIGMVLYGYCPGTGVAAIATGSVHALVGMLGMLAGGVLYAVSFPWVSKNILNVADLGKVRLPGITGIPDAVWFAALIVIALAVFALVGRLERPQSESAAASHESSAAG